MLYPAIVVLVLSTDPAMHQPSKVVACSVARPAAEEWESQAVAEDGQQPFQPRCLAYSKPNLSVLNKAPIGTEVPWVHWMMFNLNKYTLQPLGSSPEHPAKTCAAEPGEIWSLANWGPWAWHYALIGGAIKIKNAMYYPLPQGPLRLLAMHTIYNRVMVIKRISPVMWWLNSFSGGMCSKPAIPERWRRLVTKGLLDWKTLVLLGFWGMCMYMLGKFQSHYMWGWVVMRMTWATLQKWQKPLDGGSSLTTRRNLPGAQSCSMSWGLATLG